MERTLACVRSGTSYAPTTLAQTTHPRVPEAVPAGRASAGRSYVDQRSRKTEPKHPPPARNIVSRQLELSAQSNTHRLPLQIRHYREILFGAIARLPEKTRPSPSPFQDRSTSLTFHTVVERLPRHYSTELDVPLILRSRRSLATTNLPEKTNCRDIEKTCNRAIPIQQYASIWMTGVHESRNNRPRYPELSLWAKYADSRKFVISNS